MSVTAGPLGSDTLDGEAEIHERRTSSVTKNDMVIKIAQETGIEQQKVKKIVQMTLEEITEILATSERRRYELRNFGVFEVRIRKARKARNPRTGAEVMVKEKAVVTFRAGKEMEARIAQALAAQQDGHAAPRNETDGTGAGDKQ